MNLTHEERLAIREVLLLDILMKKLVKDRDLITKTVSIPEPYFDWFERVTDQINRDLHKYKQFINNAGIRITKISKEKDVVRMYYTCRGYEHQNRYLWSWIRSLTIVRMRYYFGEDIHLEDY